MSQKNYLDALNGARVDDDGRQVRIGRRYLVLVGEGVIKPWETVRVLSFSTTFSGLVRVQRCDARVRVHEALITTNNLRALVR